MKYLPFYEELLNCKDKDEVFKYLIGNLKESILLWNYFVNWDKVFENAGNVERYLNLLNSLIGKKDFDMEFESLVRQYPETITAIPVLLVRDGESSKRYRILVDYSKNKFVYEDFNFDGRGGLSQDEIKRILKFVKNTGLSRLFTENKIKNLVDYVIGVEAGLDSNGRKNRSGHAMENIVEFFVSSLCKKYGFNYLKEANSSLIKEKFGYDVPVDKSSRRYDFVINNKKTLVIVETNFYSGGGSKLKSTAGEYKTLQDHLRGSGYTFVWITDGLGWVKTQKPLRETFEHNDFLISLNMVEKGTLERIVAPV